MKNQINIGSDNKIHKSIINNVNNSKKSDKRKENSIIKIFIYPLIVAIVSGVVVWLITSVINK